MRKIIWFTLLSIWYMSCTKAMLNLSKTVIISDYSSNWESIHTVESMSIFWLKVRYQLRGYRVWSFPPIWLSMLIYKLFKVRTYKGKNITFELFVPGTGQVTYHQPWMNV